jgi:hypothetical protein
VALDRLPTWGARLSGRVIHFDIDHPGPVWTGSLVENPQASLSSASVIMAFMRILMVESVWQATTGWFPALECLVLGSHGRQWLCLALSYINDRAGQGCRRLGHLLGIGGSRVMLCGVPPRG